MTAKNSYSAECDQLKAQIKQLKHELEQAEMNLLNHEYEDGIAEMSVGVLHNIGNTLTPSKIAISMLLQRLYNSPLRKHIRGILQPLEQVIADCNIAEEEKQKLLQIIKILPDGLEEEYQLNIEDIEKIQAKQEYIANIISLQMRYSHLKVDYCDVNIQRIIDDAISMQGESLSKRGIEVITHIKKVPYVKVQESKLLQILVNLIKNAYESIDLNELSNKKIIIDCSVKDDSHIVIKIKDSGIGFIQGAEKNFFDFGYTDKSDGSGFGLHFCAHFLRSISGDISAYSEGKGKGAEFIISLPLSS